MRNMEMEPGFEEFNDRNENPEQSKSQHPRPITRRANVVIITDEVMGQRLLYGEFEDTYMNENKGIDIVTRAEKVMLDCGHEWQKGMILYRCWRGHLIDEKHAHQCPSGRIVCEKPGCGKLYFGVWYSSFWKFILDKTIGCCRGLGRSKKNQGNEVSAKELQL